jgi:hypothetical protein
MASACETDYEFVNCNVSARYPKLKELALNKRVQRLYLCSLLVSYIENSRESLKTFENALCPFSEIWKA